MERKYSMRETDAVGRFAVREVTRWLWLDPQTRRVRNVERDPAFQARDIDLLWSRAGSEIPLEVKGDRHDKTGNFFFETISNTTTGSPGCFLYTEAAYVFYCFVRPRRLHILPMPGARDWFLANIEQFAERRTRTPVGGESYTTVGRLVPVERAMTFVSGARTVAMGDELNRAGWSLRRWWRQTWGRWA